MTVNLLSQRLKAAKRELTNLKTAHRRGLGNLIVYNKYCPEISTHSQDDFTIVINFGEEYAPFPLFQILLDGYGTNIYQQANAVFSNGGRSVTVTFYGVMAYFLSFGFYVLSTAPIESISYDY